MTPYGYLEMLIRVIYDNGVQINEFEMHTSFKRINAKGIKATIRTKMGKMYGTNGYSYKIIQIERVECVL